jgi:hypothetical protein
MAERYCPRCGTKVDPGVEACPSCGRNLPGGAAYRVERSGQRKTAIWSIGIGLVIVVLGFQLEGGPRLVDTRYGRTPASLIKFEAIVAGVAFVGYGVFSLYRLRDET